MVGCALVLGLGSGAIDSGLNAYAAGAFGPRHMNWMHAFFGLGRGHRAADHDRVLSAGLAWRWGYGIVAAAQAVLALAFVLTVRAWSGRRRTGTDRGGVGRGRGGGPAAARCRSGRPCACRRSGSARWPSPLYVAIEVAAGLWAFLLLTEGRGLGPPPPACRLRYWGSLFVGRVVQGLVAERLGTVRVLRGSLAGMAAGAALIAVPGPAGWRCSAWSWSGSPPRRCSRCSPSPPPTGSAPTHADRAIGRADRRRRPGRRARPGRHRGADRPVRAGRCSARPCIVLALALLALYALAGRRTGGPRLPRLTRPPRAGQCRGRCGRS